MEIDCKEYIQDSIINNLERLLGNDVEDVDFWTKYNGKGFLIKKEPTYKHELHEMMLPYYEKYLNGDTTFCCAGSRLEFIGKEMKKIVEEDDAFGCWASKQDLIDAAEGWGRNMQYFEKESRRIYRFFHVLELLLRSDCQQDWVRISEELKEMLFMSEVCSDYKTDEVLCVLHAFTMIIQQEWTKEKKVEVFKLLEDHWLFLKHYYSVMIRHIVGVKWTDFRKVAETVLSSSQSFKPHMHIFYSGLMDCVGELHLDRKHQREMEKVIAQMQEELMRCEPSDVLYELCDTIFPEDFQRLLRENRPKSYKEVEDESRRKDELIHKVKEQNRKMRAQLSEVEEVLENMIKSSIPIEEIDKELMNFTPGMAWDLLKELNSNAAVNIQPAWREHYPTLFRKYQKRLNNQFNQQNEQNNTLRKIAERPTIGQVVLDQKNYNVPQDQAIGDNGYRLADSHY